MNQSNGNLCDADVQMLTAGFIGIDLAAKARLRRVDDIEGSEIVGRTRNAATSYAGIVFPYFTPNNYDSPREYRLRRDTPDYERNGDGELKEKGKYLGPPGRSNMIYFPPGLSGGELSDTKLPCVITEGEKKTLALYRLAKEGSDKLRFMPIGLGGVWNWKGTTGKTSASNGSRVDVKGVISDFDLIQWKGRDVIILCDANVHTNQSVWHARQGLARALAKRGANPLYAELPTDCGVNGIDDYLGLIEREQGTQVAHAAGFELLKKAVPFGNAKPLFDGEPKPLDQTLKPVAEIDADCLPTVLRNWLQPASKVIGCPFDFLVLAAITIAGSLIGSRVRIKPIQNSNWFVVPNLYAGIVGLPSTKKSPALDEARKPILRLQAASREAYKTEKAEFDIDARYFEKEDKEAKNKSKTASEYKNKLASIDKPSKPTMRRYETNDATSPKMIQFLAENPNGFTLTRDELIGWFKSLEAEYDRAARSFYLELWKGGITYDHARVSENREITITSGTLAIIGGIQPSRLQHYISDAYSYDNADGLPQRFLFAYPDARRQTKKPTQSDYEQLERGLETACGVFKTLAEKTFGGNAKSDSGDSFFPVQFDRDAQAAFDEWKDEAENEAMRLESGDEVFASFLYKLPKSCAAIALIFHCIENVNGTTVPDRITAETTVKALAYIEVMTTHARRVFALGENRIFSLAQIVLGKIKTGKLESGFTARELKRKQWSNLQSGEMIEDVLTLLTDYGYLKTIESGERRPTAKYYVNPAIQVEVCNEVE